MQTQTGHIETITPRMAERYLAFNTDNRNKKPDNIAKWAHDMKTGGWNVNGETIKFAPNGRLLDGQNRLYACVAAGVPFTTWVLRNVPEEYFTTIDIGAKRSVGDVLGIAGYKNGNKLGAALTLVWQYDNEIIRSKEIPSHVEKLALMEANPGLIDSVNYAGTFKRMNASVIALLHFKGNQSVYRGAVNEFLEQIKNGFGLTQYSPALKLRERMLGMDKTAGSISGARIDRTKTAGAAIKALNAHIMGRELRVLTFKDTEAFPVIMGAPPAHRSSLFTETAAG